MQWLYFLRPSPGAIPCSASPTWTSTSRPRRWRTWRASWWTSSTPPSWSSGDSSSSKASLTPSSSYSVSGVSPTLAPGMRKHIFVSNIISSPISSVPGSTWWPLSSWPGWVSSPCPSCIRTTRYSTVQNTVQYSIRTTRWHTNNKQQPSVGWQTPAKYSVCKVVWSGPSQQSRVNILHLDLIIPQKSYNNANIAL